MTLNEVMTQTADAIREKTGKSEKIAPIDFAEEIKSISAGGGESGGSNWRYFDVSGVSNISPIEVLCMMINTGDAIIPHTGLSTLAFSTFNEIKDKIKYIGICPFTVVTASGTQVFDDNMITMAGQQFNLTEITKEQFYTLE